MPRERGSRLHRGDNKAAPSSLLRHIGGARSIVHTRIGRNAVRTVSVLAVIAAWQGLVRVGAVDTVLVSSPVDVVKSAADAVAAGQIWQDFVVSGMELAVGMGLAFVVGVGGGLITGLSRYVFYAVDPWLTILYALPMAAIAPLIIVILGIGLTAKAFIVFLFTIFPVILNTIEGVHKVRSQYVEVATCFRAGRRTLLTSVVLPGAMPFIFVGVRLAGGRALVGVIVGEFMAAQAGIGHQLRVAGFTAHTGLLMALLVVIGFAGVLYATLVKYLERLWLRWRPVSSG